jgi:hypothetical protein
MSWYQGKVAYYVEQENGSLKSITDTYLLDAVSFTDAEARLYEIMQEQKIPDHAVKAIGPRKFSDVFDDESSEKFWQAKMVYMSLNEASGKEKRIVNNVLVRANELKDAYEKLIEYHKTVLIPYEIEALALTPILAVYKYQEKESN